MKQYLNGVIAVCTDFGVEHAIAESPELDLATFLCQEAEAIGLRPLDALALANVGGPEATRLQLDDGVAAVAAPALAGLGENSPQEPVIVDVDADDVICVDGASDGEESRQGRAPSSPRHPDPDPAPAAAAPAPAACGKADVLSRLLPNCIYLPGIKHSADNMINDVWASMVHKEEWMGHLRAIEALVRPKRMRDKIVFLFFNERDSHGSDTDMVSQTREYLRTWKASLKSLRWHECINFVRELARVKDGLRKKWDLLRFTQNLRQDTMLTEGQGFQGQKAITAAAAALRSSFFWSYSDLMLEVAETCDILSRWSEGCFLHNDKCTITSCVYKGCRAAEMAAGFYKFLLKRFQHQSNLHVLGLMHSLGDADRQRLADDWHTAQSRLQLEMEVKLNFWDRLPYKLFGLNCSKADVARAIGCHCRHLFSQLGNDQRRLEHPMTRRFLDPEWKGRGMGGRCLVCGSVR